MLALLHLLFALAFDRFKSLCRLEIEKPVFALSAQYRDAEGSAASAVAQR